MAKYVLFSRSQYIFSQNGATQSLLRLNTAMNEILAWTGLRTMLRVSSAMKIIELSATHKQLSGG